MSTVPAPSRVHPTIQAALDAICPPALPSAFVPCTHCGDPAWHRGWNAGEVVQLCPRCEQAEEAFHACQCGSRDFTAPCALREGQ